MIRMVPLLALVIAIYAATHWYRSLSSPRKAKVRRAALVGGPVIVLATLAALGRLPWAVAAAGSLLLFARRLLNLLALIPLFRQLFGLWGQGQGGRFGSDYRQPSHSGDRQASAPDPGRSASRGMNRDEALAVLGLKPGVSREEIVAAHRRLIQKNHPDQGGSDYLAGQINQARDLLLGRSQAR